LKCFSSFGVIISSFLSPIDCALLLLFSTECLL
jgi:hypothetical protein